MTEKIKNAVEIIGAGHSIQNYIPRCEHVWAMNSMIFVVEDATQGFIMDDMHWLLANPQLADYCALIKETKLPVFTSKVYPKFPFMKEYPLRAVVRNLCKQHLELTPKDFLYATSSVIYLLWYAMHCNLKIIHLHGCDFTADVAQPRRMTERFCAEYWIGVMRGLGYNVLINPISTLTNRCFIELEPEEYKMYGYEIAPKVEDWI